MPFFHAEYINYIIMSLNVLTYSNTKCNLETKVSRLNFYVSGRQGSDSFQSKSLHLYPMEASKFFCFKNIVVG